MLVPSVQVGTFWLLTRSLIESPPAVPRARTVKLLLPPPLLLLLPPPLGRRAATAHGDVGAAAALITLGGHDHVVVRAEIQAVAAQASKWLPAVMVPPTRFCCRTLQY